MSYDDTNKFLLVAVLLGLGIALAGCGQVETAQITQEVDDQRANVAPGIRISLRSPCSTWICKKQFDSDPCREQCTKADLESK